MNNVILVLEKLLENFLYFVVLLNPASKVMFLSSYEPALSVRQIRELSWKSSLAALIILVVLAGIGEVLLSRIFKVELYSLRISGGMILFIIGWMAVREGRFVQKREHQLRENFTELSLVPLAAPLIAGPGTIAAAISGTAEFGLTMTALALTLAIAVNFMLMLFARPINRLLERTHLLGPLIRLTGLIIAAVSVQMVISGLRECLFVSSV